MTPAQVRFLCDAGPSEPTARSEGWQSLTPELYPALIRKWEQLQGADHGSQGN